MKDATPKDSEWVIGYFQALHYVTIINRLINESVDFCYLESKISTILNKLFIDYIGFLKIYLSSETISKALGSSNLSEALNVTNIKDMKLCSNYIKALVILEQKIKAILNLVIKENKSKEIRELIKRLDTEQENIEKYIKQLNKESNIIEKEKVAIVLTLKNNLLVYKDRSIKLAPKEKKLLLELLENGQKTGKKLRDIDKVDSNISALKKQINIKVSEGLKIKEPLLPPGTYFISELFRISI